MNKRLNQILRYTILAGLGIGLTYFAFREIKLDKLLDKLAEARYEWVFLAIGIALLGHLSRALRWQMLIKPMGYTVPVSNLFSAVMIGYLVNIPIPRAGEFSKCGVINRTDNVPLDKLLGTMVTERLIDVFVLFLVIVLAFILEFELLFSLFEDNFGKLEGLLTPVNIGLLAMAALGGLAFVVYFIRDKKNPVFNKIKEKLAGFGDGLQSVRRVRNFPVFIFHSVFVWFTYYAMTYATFFIFPEMAELSPVAGLSVLVFGTLGFLVPVPGGSAGAYHGIIATGLAIYGIDYETVGMPFATILHGEQMIQFVVVGALGFLYVFLRQRKQIV